MYALNVASLIHILCGNQVTANTHCEELVALADEKGSAFWKAFGMLPQGHLALTGKASDAFRVITSEVQKMIGAYPLSAVVGTSCLAGWLEEHED
jgi:hypothetical protein